MQLYDCDTNVNELGCYIHFGRLGLSIGNLNTETYHGIYLQLIVCQENNVFEGYVNYLFNAKTIHRYVDILENHKL